MDTSLCLGKGERSFRLSSSNMRVPFNSLNRSSVADKHLMLSAIDRVISKGEFVLGDEGALFEGELASFLGSTYVVGCGNGTDALQLALRSIGVKSGDAVITAANAGGYATSALGIIGATPVYADVDPMSALLTVDTLEGAYLLARESNLKAVVVTHLYGAAADMPSICSWAKDRDLVIVEDCAQSLGARIGGVHVGNFGAVATTSFYPTKNLGGIGDGGAVITNNSSIKEEVVALRQYGWRTKYHVHKKFGTNSRLDEIQAAVLRLKLNKLEESNDIRRAIHACYEKASTERVRLINHSSPSFAPHLAVLQVANRDRAIQHFSELGVDTSIHYPVPDHLQTSASRDFGPTLPVTEKLSMEVLSIPLFDGLTSAEIQRVSEALHNLSIGDE